jgi:hypothetical protein
MDDRSDFFGKDAFSHDWQDEVRWRVKFYGLKHDLIGVMIVPATEPATAIKDAADFNRRFALFVDRGAPTRQPTLIRAEKM